MNNWEALRLFDADNESSSFSTVEAFAACSLCVSNVNPVLSVPTPAWSRHAFLHLSSTARFKTGNHPSNPVFL